MRRALWPYAILLVLAVCGAQAQDSGEPESNRTVLVELKFSGPEDGPFRVERGQVTRLERAAPKQYGTPQLEALFIELSAPVEGSAEKVVQYAMVVADPRFHIMETAKDDGTFEGKRVFTPEASMELALPDVAGAELVLYERIGDPGEGRPSRRELFRTGL